MGIGLPFTIFLGLLIGRNFPDLIFLFTSNGSSEFGFSGRITTILGILLTIIFVIFQSDYRKLMQNLRKQGALIDNEMCILLFFVISTMVSIYVLFLSVVFENRVVSSISEIDYTTVRVMDEFQVMSLILAVCMLAIYLWSIFDSNDPDIPSNLEESSNSVNENSTSSHKITNSVKNIISILFAAFYMGRIRVSAIAGFAIFIITIMHDYSLLLESFVVSLTMTALCMFGFVINDICDFQKDLKSERSDKLLSSRKLNLNQAISLCVFLLMFGFSPLIIVFGYEFSQDFLLLVFLLCLYSPFSDKVPVAKGLFTAILCMSPAYYANVLAGEGIVAFPIFVFGVLFFVGRELTLDSIDYERDLRSGVRTLAVVLGKNLSQYLGWVIMIIGFTVLAYFSTSLSQGFALCGIVTLIFLLIYSVRDAAFASTLSRLSILLGVCSVALGI